jgi:26S proteasome non-ATPase regulatory subunit 10
LVELLLKNRSPLNATDSAGYTPLHHAIAEGHGMLLNTPEGFSI